MTLWLMSKNNKKTWWYTGERKCSECKKNITEHNGVYVYDYNPKNCADYLYCLSCTKEGKIIRNTHHQNLLMVWFTDIRPPHSMPYIPNPTIFKNPKQGMDIFQAADELQAETTEDKTIYSISRDKNKLLEGVK